jgi:transcription antitermination factor NusG
MLSNTIRATGTATGETAVATAGVRTGAPVKVREGPFRGKTGAIIERKPNRLALVQIDVLGRPVCVEVDPRHIDVLN